MLLALSLSLSIYIFIYIYIYIYKRAARICERVPAQCTSVVPVSKQCKCICSLLFAWSPYLHLCLSLKGAFMPARCN